MLPLIWTDNATENVEDIFGYIAPRNLGAALRLRETLRACAEKLPAHPYMYRAGRLAATREAVVTPNYIIVYRVGRDRLEILSVLHARQKYP